MLKFRTHGPHASFTGLFRRGDGAAGGAAGGDGGGGATPPAPTPPAIPPANPEDQLGDAGRRALQAERDARAAEKKRADDLASELEKLKAASQTDQEKALAEAKKAAAAERDEHWATQLRRTEVRSALRLAGITNEKLLDVATNAPEFAGLTLEGGTVKDLDKTVESFKKDFPELFAKAAPAAGAPTRGVQDGQPAKPKGLGEAIAAAMSAKP